MCLLTLTEKGNDRKRKESRQCRRQLVVRATVFTVSCHSLQRMSSSLFSLSTRLLFVSYSLILEKKQFSCILSSLPTFGDNTLLSFIFCTTPLRLAYTNKYNNNNNYSHHLMLLLAGHIL
jgi:hypothetical protein